MGSRKYTLIKEAKKLKIDTEGTIADLEERIEDEYAAREKAAKAEAKAEKEAAAIAEKAKELKVKKAAEAKVKEAAAKKEVPKKAPKKEIPRAIPIAEVTDQETAIALKTTVKFVGGWRHLKKGKAITAPKNVMAILRQANLIEE